MSKTFTAAELAPFTGDNGTAIYVSVKGKVYDCSTGAEFYGPGGPYAVFAGKDVSRCLGKMQIDDTEANAAWDNLSDEHMQTLDEWAAKFEKKYPVVGEFLVDESVISRGKHFEA